MTPPLVTLRDVYQAGAASGIRAGALEFLYELMKERDPEINISHRELPTFEQHRQFWCRRIYRFVYLIERDYDPSVQIHVPFDSYAHAHARHCWVGYVSATHANEIGIVLQKEYRGHGFGPAAIKAVMGYHKPNPAEPGVRSGNWLANIAPANEHSKHVFMGLGFRKVQETFEFQSPEEAPDGKKD